MALGEEATGDIEESETDGLLGGRTNRTNRAKRKYASTGNHIVVLSAETNGLFRAIACMCLFALVGALGLAFGLACTFRRASDNMAAVEAAIRPHASQVINTTLEAMSDMGGSFHNMHEISEYTNELAAAAGGAAGTASTTINNTAIITKRLAAFLAHPTLKLSLGDSLDT